MTALFAPGRYEGFKQGCHLSMLGLAVAFTAYNGVAWLLRGDRHLARNTGLYAALIWVECVQAQKHRRHRG